MQSYKLSGTYKGIAKCIDIKCIDIEQFLCMYKKLLSLSLVDLLCCQYLRLASQANQRFYLEPRPECPLNISLYSYCAKVSIVAGFCLLICNFPAYYYGGIKSSEG